MVLRRDRGRPLGECVVRNEARFEHFALLGAGLLLPPPALGEHTESVLRELGFAPSEIAALRSKTIV